MSTESGDNKLIGNFRKLIDEVSADPDYDPSNDKLKIPALESQYTAGAAVVLVEFTLPQPGRLVLHARGFRDLDHEAAAR